VLYHFGSRTGLVEAIVQRVEAEQRTLMTAEATVGDPTAVIRDSWRRTSAPEVRPLVQLFFEAVAYAARRGGADFTGPWIDDATTLAAGLGIDADPAQIRLGIAVVRGLMIDVVLTDDTGPATESFEAFLRMWAAVS
jgi:AcrR family transcriptional regulator